MQGTHLFCRSDERRWRDRTKSNQLYGQAFVQTQTELVKIWYSDHNLGNARPLWMVCISE
jgi:hypothetical protein